MKRGFPRPTMFVKEVSSWRLDEVKDKYGNQTYPIPYTARTEEVDYNLSMLENGRVAECITLGNCIVCGDYVERGTDDLVWVYRTTMGRINEDSGPFHEKCAKLTMVKCPVVKEGNTFVFSQERWSDVGPLIRGKHDFSRKS